VNAALDAIQHKTSYANTNAMKEHIKGMLFVHVLSFILIFVRTAWKQQHIRIPVLHRRR
jgi:hypothetical protein